jgi:hypothetical protein
LFFFKNHIKNAQGIFGVPNYYVILEMEFGKKKFCSFNGIWKEKILASFLFDLQKKKFLIFKIKIWFSKKFLVFRKKNFGAISFVKQKM